ncbi:MAG: GNAT family N-acetyltransferase [Clostridia bacterium]|nr:GNAT family N-acetyltransferase [Clostridia bacterium]
MGEFFRLKDSEFQEAHDYAKRHMSACFFIMQGFYKKNGERQEHLDAATTYYIYREQGVLKGIVYVNKSKVLFPFFESEKAYQKMDLLKIIKYHQPAIIRGTTLVIDAIYRIIERVMPLYQHKDLILMDYRGDILHGHVDYVTGGEIDFNKAVDFLISAEQAFSRNPLSINQLKIKIGDTRLKNRYYFLLEEDRVVAQGLVEFCYEGEMLVGGIYTHPKRRQQGYGEQMSILLTQMAMAEDKTPYLIVEKKNHSAVNLYHKIGYREVEAYEELILAKI